MRGDKSNLDQFLPAVRRRSLTTLDGLLKNTIAQSFLSYISGIKDHKKALKQSEEAISSHFKKINSIITMVDQHITRRLQTHQNQLFAVVKGQIQTMKQETREIVERMNEAIARKNTEDEIWQLNNQLDYFKAQTLSIFNQNRKMKDEIIHLANSLRQAQIQLDNNDVLMQKLKKKYMRENQIKQKIVSFLTQTINNKQTSLITLDKITQLLNHKPEIKIKLITERSFQTKPKEGEQSIAFDSIDFSMAGLHHFQSGKKTSQPLRINSPYCLERELTSNKATQTDQHSKQQAPKILTLRHFSNTSYVQLPANVEKRINALKNGFSLRTKMKNRSRQHTDNSSICKLENQSKRHSRYMSIALNNNKLGRSSKNKSTEQF